MPVDPVSTAEALHQRAEALLREQFAQRTDKLQLQSPEMMKQVLHELEVHQIELEMQVEALGEAKDQLEVAHARYVDLYDFAPVGYCTLSENSLILQVNLTLCTMLGVTRSPLIKQPISKFFVNDDQDIYFQTRKELLRTRLPQWCEIRMSKADGSQFWIHLAMKVVEPEEGQVSFHVVLSDVTERKRAEEVSRLNEKRYLFSLEVTGQIGWSCLPDGQLEDAPMWRQYTGQSLKEVVGWKWLDAIHPEDRESANRAVSIALAQKSNYSTEYRLRRADGVYRNFMVRGIQLFSANGSCKEWVGTCIDITERKAHEMQLEHMAHFDALTNLPNRVLLADRVQQAIAQAHRRGQKLAVSYLDLDGFKAINDRWGHELGDQVLIALAARLKHALREGDTLARIGGDEFVAVMIDLEDVAECLPMLTRLLGAAAQSVSMGDIHLQVTASLGVTFYPQTQDLDADQLLRQADQAMYQAKLAGKNRYHVFDAEQDSSIRGHHENRERIRLALVQHEFVLHYQPKINMRGGQVIGAEALIRWQHPEKGLLAPGTFLPAIEDHTLAIEVGEWVIETALTQIEVWRAAGLDLAVSVNIGARQLQQADFVQRVQAILAKHPQVNPASLELEVLETSALADVEQVSHVIEDCHQMGVKFALDDFGTGYSSLTYLKRLRVALLKIDQSFVRDMLEDPNDLAILEGVIGLASAFKCDVIAEGVETVAHGTALLHLGCERAQGYGIARPMPPDQLPAWVSSWKPDDAWAELPWLGGVEQR